MREHSLLSANHLAVSDVERLRRAGFEPTFFVGDGQSNATTTGKVSELTDASYGAAFAGVTYQTQQSGAPSSPMVYESTTIQTLDSVTFQAYDRIGVEHIMLRSLYTVPEAAGKVHAGNVGVYGAAYTHIGPSSGFPLSTGVNIWGQKIPWIRQAMTDSATTRLAVVFSHGSSDALSLGLSTAYAANLLEYIDAYRVEFPGCIFIIRLLSESSVYSGMTSTTIANVRAAQTAAAAARTLVYLDDDNGAALSVDQIHFDSNGDVIRGYQLAGTAANALGIHIPPEALFSASVASLVLTCTDLSRSPSDAITSRLYDYGDGTGTTASTSHTYATPGTYNVTLTIVNAYGASDTSPITPVTVASLAVDSDATSAIYRPSSTTQWSTLMTAEGGGHGAPTRAFMCQDASGNPVDMFGGVALTAANTPAYLQAVSGHSAKAITFTDASAKSLQTASATLPDISTTSQLVLMAYKFPAAAPAVGRAVLTIGSVAGATGFEAAILATSGFLRIRSGANTTTGTTNMCDGLVHFLALRVNRSSLEADGYTEIEKLSPTAAAGMTGKLIDVGAQTAGLLACASGPLMIASWEGSPAEWTDAQVRTAINFIANGFVTVAW